MNRQVNLEGFEVGYDIPALPGMDEADIQTPCLVLDLDALERNIVKMGAFIKKHGVRHRSHGKMHKSVDVQKLQESMGGACGVCCQKVSEAEVFARGGIKVRGQQHSGRLFGILGAAQGKRVQGRHERVVHDHGEGSLGRYVDQRACAVKAQKTPGVVGGCLGIEPDWGVHVAQGQDHGGHASAPALRSFGLDGERHDPARAGHGVEDGAERALAFKNRAGKTGGDGLQHHSSPRTRVKKSTLLG